MNSKWTWKEKLTNPLWYRAVLVTSVLIALWFPFGALRWACLKVAGLIDRFDDWAVAGLDRSSRSAKQYDIDRRDNKTGDAL